METITAEFVKDLEEYVKFTESTFVVDSDVSLAYVSLGLVSEVAEYLGLECFSNTLASKPLSEYDKVNALLELGDIFYYYVRFLEYFYTKEGLNQFLNTYSEYDTEIADLVSKDKIPSEDDYEFNSLTITFCMVDLSGKLASNVKKHLRGDSNYQDMTLFRTFCEPLFFNFLFMFDTLLSSKYQVSLQTVMNMNQKKLTERKKRGTIKGDGDNR